MVTTLGTGDRRAGGLPEVVGVGVGVPLLIVNDTVAPLATSTLADGLWPTTCPPARAARRRVDRADEQSGALDGGGRLTLVEPREVGHADLRLAATHPVVDGVAAVDRDPGLRALLVDLALGHGRRAARVLFAHQTVRSEVGLDGGRREAGQGSSVVEARRLTQMSTVPPLASLAPLAGCWRVTSPTPYWSE